MKKIQMVLLAVLIAAGSFAQKGNNQIGLGSDVTFPTGDFGYYFKTGFGGYAKAMLGVGTAGQVTFTTGYTSNKGIGAEEDWNATMGILPLLVGYRHYIKNFFVEPQAGYGVYVGKFTEDGEFFTESAGAFTFAASAGITFTNRVEVSARYQTGGKEGTNFGLFGLRLGYNFNLKSSK